MATKTRTITNFVALDAILLAVACLVPAASHAFALPLYKLNPMLAVLLAGMLIGKDWRNSLVLAVLLPAVSCLIAGMPTPTKMLCMMGEMVAVVGFFAWLGRSLKPLPAVLIAIVAGKGVYYLLKALIISPATLISTSWELQLIAVLLWGGLFALLYGRIRSSKE